MRAALAVSASLHAGAILVLMLISLKTLPHRPLPEVFPVDLVRLPPRPPQALEAPTAPVEPKASNKVEPPKAVPPEKEPRPAPPARAKRVPPRVQPAPTPTAKTEPVVPPSTQPEVARPEAANVASPSGIELKGFPFPSYRALIERKLRSQWAPPGVARRETVRAVARFMILRNGRIADLEIEESSGNPFFDQAVLRAVRLSEPFPPFPSGYNKDSMPLVVGFRLEGRLP